ncbi:hypothetical protein [Desulfobacula sp.]|uniref:hypothetical protein n=1 Tax=Desulfobacula sp. TaxID=2593537 RepID=UPI0027146F20|nr:hypothetical protein [Desulfobacula sp.]
MNDFLQSLRNGQAGKQQTPKTRKNYDNSYHYTSPPRFPSSGGYQNTRNQYMKKSPAPQQAGNQPPMDDTSTIIMLAEAIESLGSHFEILAKNQDYMINAQERTIDMLERQAIAIEKIVDHLNIDPGKVPVPIKNSAYKKTFEHHYVTSQKPKSDITESDITEPDITESVKKPVKKPVKTPVENIEPKKTIIRKRKKIVAKKNEKNASADPKLLSRKTVMDIIHSMRAEGATFDMVASRLVELGQPTFSGRGEWHAQTIHRLCNKK